MTGPLEGITVLDLTWGMPGAVAGMLLADYGAEVLKVERPGTGDRPTLFRVLDRGKRSIVLDPADAATGNVLHELLARADVVLDTAGSGWLADDGEPDARHPHLVRCRVGGYGDGGPLAGRPAYDILVAARFGLMAEQRGHRDGPIFLGHPSLDYVTAFLAVVGVLAALHARTITGRGQRVDTSMLDGALALSTMNWWWNERNLSYLAREGNEKGFGRSRLITDLFRCQDGTYLMVHTGGAGGFQRTMDLLGLAEHIRPVEGLEMSVPLDDEELHAARHLAPEVFTTRPRDEWIAAFHAEDLAALPVLPPEEVFADDQVRFAGVVVDVPDSEHGRLRQVGPVVRFERAPVGPTAAAPLPGQHDDELPGWLERAPRQVGATAGAAASALEGVRVLDFSGFFATAFGARLLSDLGADVIKVEPLHGDQMRPLPDLFEGAQRGKRNLAVDLRSPEGAEVVRRLLATADVVMHNQRPGKAEKLGFGYEQAVALNPRVVYCYLPGFGSSGPKADLKSFAPLVSGFTGMLYIGAGEGNPPVTRVLGNEDLYNGFSGAMAVLMALQHRDRTGEGQYVESPHLHSSLLVRTEQAATLDGAPVAGLGLDAEQTGWGPLYRLYRTGDGWLAIACVGQRRFEQLAEALGIEAAVADERFADDRARAANGDELAAVLAAAFATRTSAEAFACLDAAGVPCEIPLDDPLMPEFLWDEWALETGRIYEHYHPEHGWIREVGQCVRLSDTPAVNKGPSVRLGEHTREVLAELGFDDAEIEALLVRACREPS